MMNPQQAFDMEDMEGDCLTAALEEFSCMMANMSDPRRKTEVTKYLSINLIYKTIIVM